MKANIKKNRSLLNIKEVSKQFAILRILNINTGEYVDTLIKLIYADVNLNERVQTALKALGEKHDELMSKINLDEIKAETDKTARVIQETASLTDKELDMAKSYALAATSLLTQSKIGEMAKDAFDSIFGAGALDSLVYGQFNLHFTPDFFTTIEFMQAIAALSTTLSAKKIGDTYSELKEKSDKLKERYDNV